MFGIFTVKLQPIPQIPCIKRIKQKIKKAAFCSPNNPSPAEEDASIIDVMLCSCVPIATTTDAKLQALDT